MKAQLALCMKYMPAACMKSLTLTHEGWEFGFANFQFFGMREIHIFAPESLKRVR